MDQSQKIIESWKANAQNWIGTVDNSEIESRVLATNEAIVKTIFDHTPQKVLDIGCGEGWLVRELRNKGISAFGVDAISELIQNAVQKDGNNYHCYAYSEIASGSHDLPSPFDAIVINFALIDKEETQKLIYSLPSLLNKNGLLIIQTLHPLSVALNDEYVTGWKDGSWKGMKRDFVLPYQWYFRTMQDWIQLFSACGFHLVELREPLHPQTKKPLSVIFILRTNSN